MIIAIFFIGILNLYSASHRNSSPGLQIYQYQLLWFVVALLIGFLVSLMHPKNYFRFSYLIFGANVVMLIGVLYLGKTGMGAQRWLELGPIRFQPSEFMKISVVLVLSRWLSTRKPGKEMGFKEMFMPCILVAFPAFLIIKQPDLGTGLILILILAVMVFYRRLKMKTILILGLTALTLVPLVYQYGLKDYQKRRILTFINPTEDARGSGYNAIQSEIAIGSGRILGKGFKKSSQASLNYLPENHTDFVFSVFNEEHGFFGALILIVLYLILFLRMVWLTGIVLKFYDSLLIIGLMSIFFWHTFINMCMVTGLMPIVGLPLPLFSYGGSSLLTFGVCGGMITSVSNTRKLF